MALRACHNGACQSTPSAFALGVTPVNPQITGLTYAQPGLLDGGTFTWTGWPTGSYDNIQFSCNGGNSWTTADTSGAGTCTVPLLAQIQLIIRVTANGGATYDAHYDQDGNVS